MQPPLRNANSARHKCTNAADPKVDGAPCSPAGIHSVTTYAITASFFSNACFAASAASQLS